MAIGDYLGPGPVNFRRALLVFDISSLPTGISSFLAADLSVAMCCLEGDPSLLGAVWVHHISVSPIDGAYFYATPLDTPGILSNTASLGIKTLSVKEALEADYEQRVPRGNQVQLRVQLAIDRNENASNDGVTLDKVAQGETPTEITATFLIE